MPSPGRAVNGGLIAMRFRDVFKINLRQDPETKGLLLEMYKQDPDTDSNDPQGFFEWVLGILRRLLKEFVEREGADILRQRREREEAERERERQEALARLEALDPEAAAAARRAAQPVNRGADDSLGDRDFGAPDRGAGTDVPI